MKKLAIIAASTILLSVLASETATANTEKGKCEIKETSDNPTLNLSDECAHEQFIKVLESQRSIPANNIDYTHNFRHDPSYQIYQGFDQKKYDREQEKMQEEFKKLYKPTFDPKILKPSLLQPHLNKLHESRSSETLINNPIIKEALRDFDIKLTRPTKINTSQPRINRKTLDAIKTYQFPAVDLRKHFNVPK